MVWWGEPGRFRFNKIKYENINIVAININYGVIFLKDKSLTLFLTKDNLFLDLV